MSRSIRALFVLLFALLATIDAAAAQQIVVRGRVLGPDGKPFASDRVVLHRVDQMGGATVAEGPTQPDGRFTLTAPATSDTAGVYFLAARYAGELYIGQPFRTGDSIPEQMLQVGVVDNSATAMLEAASAPPAGTPNPRTRNWWWLLLPLLACGAAVIYFVFPRQRVAPERRLLIRIAEIDERITGAPPGQRDSLLQERSFLIEQLRTG